MRFLLSSLVLISAAFAVDFPVNGQSIYVIRGDRSVRILTRDVIAASLKDLALLKSARRDTCRMSTYFGIYDSNGIVLMGEVDTARNCLLLADAKTASTYWAFEKISSFRALLRRADSTSIVDFTGDSAVAASVQRRVYAYQCLVLPGSKLDGMKYRVYLPTFVAKQSALRQEVAAIVRNARR